ncbi:MAG: RNA polymerase subunit sigma, partial [Firmicutes bacterium]|nr:RNA polymerase subunit sigma [Bacillota bacterium]
GYKIKIDDDNLLKLIETMPEEIKNVLLLKFFQNFNDLEIANMLGLKRRTVNYRKLKAINYLKENL